MRATTCWTPKVSRATRALMMLELSPLLTAAKAPAVSMPASSRVCRSKPSPVTWRPANSGPSRRKASGSWSMTATLWPTSSSRRAMAEPTRPQPITTTCTKSSRRSVAPAPSARAYRARSYTRATARPRGATGATSLSRAGRAARRAARRRRRPYHRRRAQPVRPRTTPEAARPRPRRSAATALGESLLSKRLALPIFASDALSSVAYATQEILIVLTLGGTAYLYLAPWLAAGVVVLLITRGAVLPAGGARLPVRRRRLRGRDEEPRAVRRRSSWPARCWSTTC